MEPNKIYISHSALNKDFVAPNDYRATAVHELIHWKDAVEYRKQYPDMAGYADWIKQRCKEKLIILCRRDIISM